MTTPLPPDILKQVLEIVDLFEDENMHMAADTILLNPALKLRRISAPDDLAEFVTDEGRLHTAMMYAARSIGNAIRERFGLPPKKDEIFPL